ncbi:MAG: DUF3046 domain-containing protein [Micrococcales bacterium]|nr:DUF3046 domain-containing protein [Micrococcales bacterium]
MRHSEFTESMDRAFGATYAKSLASDLVIGALGGRTAEEALAGGTPPRQVWDALCDAMEVGDDLRWAYRAPVPPKRRRQAR